jgi:hypothetical protein
LNAATLSWHSDTPAITAILSLSENFSPKTHLTLDGGPEISFDPPLVDNTSVPDGTNATDRFTLFFRAEMIGAVEGTVTVSREREPVTILLQPDKTEWLRTTRVIRYDIDLGPKDS